MCPLDCSAGSSRRLKPRPLQAGDGEELSELISVGYLPFDSTIHWVGQ